MAQVDETSSISSERILNCDGESFFNNLEKYMKTKIPKTVRNILQMNDMDTAVVYSTFTDTVITGLEHFYRNVFNSKMLIGTETMRDYLGRYVDTQDKFMFSFGQASLIKLIASTCKTICVQNQTASTVAFNEQNPSASTVSINDQSNEDDDNSSLAGTCTTTIELYESVDQPGEDDEIRFFNYIGSLIIRVFNDAKKLTLRTWSWPSRLYAAEKANQFKKDGTLLSNFNLQYVNPTQHAALLDSIVKSDLHNFISRIKDSLALSLRVDGSVDRTQNHNVFVLANIVHKDATMDTVFLGFDIPENEEDDDDGAAAYFQCIKTVITDIMPWQDFFRLMSSLVTDGESLNIGPKNGLWARLVREHELYTCLPLILIWCMAHRITLAWKSVCDDNTTVVDIIKIASQLCTFFHNSGKRTAKLRNAAKDHDLSTPLQYPSYNSTRWVQYAFDLMNTVLRNWRASMIYFITENKQSLEECWLSYDRLRWLTFLTDVLRLLKTFQKSFESDTNTILELKDKKRLLFEALQNAIHHSTENGWEELFLSEIDDDGEKLLFYGHNLTTETRTRNISIYAYTFEKREAIVRSMLENLDERLEIDELKEEALRPLHPITLSSSNESLKLCHKFIVPDFDQTHFIAEYRHAGNLLQNYHYTTPLNTLRTLNEFLPESFMILKTALARLAAAKPHLADAERFINLYNKVKDTDRTSSSASTLYNHLYVHMNMPTLEKFDPSPAVRDWMTLKKRKPVEGSKSKQQEWFKGVYDEMDELFKRKHSTIVKF